MDHRGARPRARLPLQFAGTLRPRAHGTPSNPRALARLEASCRPSWAMPHAKRIRIEVWLRHLRDSKARERPPYVFPGIHTLFLCPPLSIFASSLSCHQVCAWSKPPVWSVTVSAARWSRSPSQPRSTPQPICTLCRGRPSQRGQASKQAPGGPKRDRLKLLTRKELR